MDACIRALRMRQTFPNTAQGHRKLVAWLRKHQVNKAVMEASGGYERDWARVLREAGIEVRIVDPKRVRSFALSAGRLAKNDAIDAEMIAWFAETFGEAPGQTHDAAREELQALVKARLGLIDFRIRLVSQKRTCRAGIGSKSACPHLEEPGQRDCQARGRHLRQNQIHAGFCRARRDHRECAGLRRDELGKPRCRHAGARPGERRDRRCLDRRRPL